MRGLPPNTTLAFLLSSRALAAGDDQQIALAVRAATGSWQSAPVATPWPAAASATVAVLPSSSTIVMSGARFARKARTDSYPHGSLIATPRRDRTFNERTSLIGGTTMRTALLAAAVIAAAGIAHAQNPTAKLPSQAELPASPSTTATPNAGTDEVAARRKLEDQGYRDLRNVTPNSDAASPRAPSGRTRRARGPASAPTSMSRSMRRATSGSADGSRTKRRGRGSVAAEESWPLIMLR